MKKKIKGKDFIISIIGRDLRKTPEPEEKRKEDLQESASRKEDSEKKQNLKKNKTHYRVEYTKDGPKFWTLHQGEIFERRKSQTAVEQKLLATRPRGLLIRPSSSLQYFPTLQPNAQKERIFNSDHPPWWQFFYYLPRFNTPLCIGIYPVYPESTRGSEKYEGFGKQ